MIKLKAMGLTHMPMAPTMMGSGSMTSRMDMAKNNGLMVPNTVVSIVKARSMAEGD